MTTQNKTAVSVVLPVYNGGRFLRAAMESVFAQSGIEKELIVVDGASTDETLEVVKGFGTDVRYFRTGRDNTAIAKNFGVRQVRHELVAFISSDDVWLPQKLQKQIDWMRSNPLCPICVCKLKYFLQAGCSWPASFPEKLKEGEHVGLVPETLLFRREVWDRVGQFNETLVTAEDVDWFARVKNAGEKIGVMDEVLLHKRVHDRNTSLVEPNAKRDLLRAVRQNLRRKEVES